MHIAHLHSPNKTLITNAAIQFILDEFKEPESSIVSEPITQFAPKNNVQVKPNGIKETAAVQISHPWPEWVGLMEMLMKKAYFEGIGNPFSNGEVDATGSNFIRTACLNFARERFDLIRYLSRKDIQVVAESGCPSIDRKVVNSGKRLRAHVGINEGNVCSSCILRGNCERAYVKACKDEGGRTVDVMRFLLTYGLDPITGSVENKPCLNKRVKESVRRLLKEMVELNTEKLDDFPKAIPSKSNSSMQEISSHKGQSQINVPMKQGDWMCPKCNFLNFARNIKCLRCNGLFQERLRKLSEDQDHLPLKKGDWICDKCNFLNFAKNSRCLQCQEKPPKWQLNPGEWECDSCNYINFRKNMVCLKCDHRRPKALKPTENSAQLLHDAGDNHHPQPYFVRERRSEEEGGGRWKFVEDEAEDTGCSKSLNEVPGFVDFPIAGGKSKLSQNVQKQERWKTEMAERSRSSGKARENVDEFKSAFMQKSCKFLESTDDEEMAEWFGHAKDPL
ncbi:unnamed protein product [Ilex paraguariensis]